MRDVLIACCDGLDGLAEAIETIWRQTVVQTCVVHLIRATMRFVSYNDRKAVTGMLKEVYTAANEDAALTALAAFADSNLGKRYPGAVGVWERAWERFTPFLAFPPEVRRIIYTTNAVVIWSPRGSVFDVRHGALRCRVLRGGRGYLQSSRRQSLRRDDASGTGRLAGLVA